MSNRHLARTVALQTLYEWDFNEQTEKDIIPIIERNVEEFARGFDERDFSVELVKSVIEKKDDLDKKIKKYAPEWPLEKITIVDRNILRLGIIELMYMESIPDKVAINEAIELGKNYGGPASGKFVNGILGALYNELPKEDDATEKN